jgi:predicted nucleic acid-binding protein
MNWDRLVGEAIYLDANIVILAVESHEPKFRVLRSLFEEFDRASVRAVTSELTIAEVMAKPIAAHDDALISKYTELFLIDSALEVIPIDRAVLILSAELRGKLRLKLFDAIHVATARLAGCGHLLTQDERLWRTINDEPHWLQIPELS